MHLSFQFKLPLSINQIGFSTVVFGKKEIQERIHFKVNQWQNFGWDRESVLLGISILFPYFCSVIVSFLILKIVLDKIFKYRKTVFLRTIEGERLSRIEPFNDLAQVPHALHNHISDLVRLAPASAHLQSKFKSNLLNIISHFEIKEKKAMPEHIQWACKVRPTPSNYIIDFKNYIRQVFTRTGWFKPLAQSDDSNDDVLEDSGVQERFKCYMFKSFQKKYQRNVGFSQTASALENMTIIVKKIIVDADKTKSTLCVSSSKEETQPKIFDYVVVRLSSNPLIGYCIKIVSESEDEGITQFKFNLFSLDNRQKLVFADDVTTATLMFEDPYNIDDNFINFVFSNNTFDNNTLIASVNRFYDTYLRPFEKYLKRITESSKMCDHCGVFACKSWFCHSSLKVAPNSCPFEDFNPFQDRIIMTVAAIFYESVESYRAIVSSTGIEGFFDMLIVNGSLNLSKWKIIGTIDQIMDEFHQKQSEKDGTRELPFDSRIPAFLAEDMSKITCRRSFLQAKIKKMQNSSSKTDCTLHGPATCSQDVVRFTESNHGVPKTVKMISEASGIVSKAKIWLTDSKHSYEEHIDWRPFQPGCLFEMDVNLKLQENPGGKYSKSGSIADLQKSPEPGTAKIVSGDVRLQFFGNTFHKSETNKINDCTSIELVDDEEHTINCHLHVQCFQALEQKVEAMCADEFEFSNTSSALYSHQLLHAYRPRGVLNNSLSILIHSCFCGLAVCPTLFFFVFWAYNNVNTYLIHPYWTPAAYVVIYTVVFAGICVVYFLVVYLEFPFIFYGKSLISEDINYFWFKPVIGIWYSTSSRCHFELN
jgi:hypothetical protein